MTDHIDSTAFGNGRLGFGFMRLPLQGRGAPAKRPVDIEETIRMTDAFMAAGMNYFDTARGYLAERSEQTIREALVDRYPRDRFVLTDKLTGDYLHSREDVRPFLLDQLRITGAGYFDWYLLHAITAEEYRKYLSVDAFSQLKAFRAEGLIRHIGISFHDKPELLEQVLSEHPEIEAVQIQLNYFDYLDPAVQSRRVYEVCERFEKPVMVMEPIKGGSLAFLPEEAKAAVEVAGVTPAALALRFAASHKYVVKVLSGMGTMAQLQENVSTLCEEVRLSDAEHAAIESVCESLRARDLIPCTGCRYCVKSCPMQIPIPDLFAIANSRKLFGGWNSSFYYDVYTAEGSGRASSCIGCRTCAGLCPQHLDIPELLASVAKTFEKQH